MAKKKRKTRKQKQQRHTAAQPRAATTPTTESATATRSTVVAETAKQSDEYAYVRKEIRHILLIVLSFVVIELALWFVFGKTGLETRLTHLIKF